MIIYLGNNISSIESDVNIYFGNALTAIDRLSSIRTSDILDKIKGEFFLAVALLEQLYGCTTWTLGKKLDGNNTKMSCVVLKKSCKQHPTIQLLYGHIPPISRAILVKWTIVTGCNWTNRDELINEILWTSRHGHISDDRPAKTNIHELCADMWTG